MQQGPLDFETLRVVDFLRFQGHFFKKNPEMVEFCDSLKQFWMVKVEEDGWSALHFASKEGHLQAELFQEWLWKFQLIFIPSRVESGEVCQTLIQFRADAGLGPFEW